MTEALVIMHCRDIPEVRWAFDQLDIAKVWLTGYTEKELADGVFMAALDDAGFDRYVVCSDDIIVRPEALDAVLDHLDDSVVTTGYSQRSHTEWTVNLTDKELAGEVPHAEAYSFLRFQDIVSWPTKWRRTWFTGFSLTCMTAEMWKRYPFDCYGGVNDPGFASDFHLSLRLQRDTVPIYAARAGFCYHWRNEWRNTNHVLDEKPQVGAAHQKVTIDRLVYA